MATRSAGLRFHFDARRDFAGKVRLDFGTQSFDTAFDAEGLREFFVNFGVLRFGDFGHLDFEFSGLAVEALETVIFREGEREGLFFAGLHALDGFFEFGEHAAFAEHEDVAFGRTALESGAVDLADEVERDAVFVLSGAIAGGIFGALLDHRLDRGIDGFVRHFAFELGEFNLREVGQFDFGEDFERGDEVHFVLVVFRAGLDVDAGSAGHLETGFAGSVDPGLGDELVDGFVKSLHAVHGTNLLHRNMALAEARHADVLGLLHKLAFGEFVGGGGRNREFEGTLEGIDFDLFDGLFIRFSHRYFFAKRSWPVGRMRDGKKSADTTLASGENPVVPPGFRPRRAPTLRKASREFVRPKPARGRQTNRSFAL